MITQITTLSFTLAIDAPCAYCEAAFQRAQHLKDAAFFFNLPFDVITRYYVEGANDVMRYVIRFVWPLSYTEQSKEELAFREVLRAGGDAFLKQVEVKVEVRKD